MVVKQLAAWGWRAALLAAHMQMLVAQAALIDAEQQADHPAAAKCRCEGPAVPCAALRCPALRCKLLPTWQS